MKLQQAQCISMLHSNTAAICAVYSGALERDRYIGCGMVWRRTELPHQLQKVTGADLPPGFKARVEKNTASLRTLVVQEGLWVPSPQVIGIVGAPAST